MGDRSVLAYIDSRFEILIATARDWSSANPRVEGLQIEILQPQTKHGTYGTPDLSIFPPPLSRLSL